MSENRDEVAALIDRILDTATLSVQELGDETGISRHTLWAWAAGRRNPSRENLEKLATALEERGSEILREASNLWEAAGAPHVTLQRDQRMEAQVSLLVTLALLRSDTSTAALAEAAGVSPSTIRAWRSGRQSPRTENLESLARALELIDDQLLADLVRQVADRDPAGSL